MAPQVLSVIVESRRQLLYIVVVAAHIFPSVTGQRQTLTIGRTFHCNDCFVTEGIRTCLGVSSDSMFFWITLNSCPLNLLLVRSHQAEKIIKNHLIQGRNNVTSVRIESTSCIQGRHKNDAFTPLGYAVYILKIYLIFMFINTNYLY